MFKEQTEIMIKKFKPLFILDNLVDTYDELLFSNLNMEIKHRSSIVTEENFLEEYVFPFFDTLIVDNNPTVTDEIEIVDTTEKTEQEELVEDLIQIMTVFSCKLQGKRANKTKKLLKELVINETNHKSSIKTNS